MGPNDRVAKFLARWLESLVRQSRARAAFVLDRHAQMLAAVGSGAGLDTMALAHSLGNRFAVQPLKRLSLERGFAHYDEESGLNVDVQLVMGRLLVVLISGTDTSLGLVRLSLKRGCEVLATGSDAEQAAIVSLPEFTDDDLESPFESN
jgi:hypothetical protein